MTQTFGKFIERQEEDGGVPEDWLFPDVYAPPAALAR